MSIILILSNDKSEAEKILGEVENLLKSLGQNNNSQVSVIQSDVARGDYSLPCITVIDGDNSKETRNMSVQLALLRLASVRQVRQVEYWRRN